MLVFLEEYREGFVALNRKMLMRVRLMRNWGETRYLQADFLYYPAQSSGKRVGIKNPGAFP